MGLQVPVLASIFSLVYINIMQPLDEVKLSLKIWMNKGTFGLSQTSVTAWPFLQSLVLRVGKKNP